MTLMSVCEIIKNKRNASHKIFTGVKLFLSVLCKYRVSHSLPNPAFL